VYSRRFKMTSVGVSTARAIKGQRLPPMTKNTIYKP